jgi:hypothetical protein
LIELKIDRKRPGSAGFKRLGVESQSIGEARAGKNYKHNRKSNHMIFSWK